MALLLHQLLQVWDCLLTPAIKSSTAGANERSGTCLKQQPEPTLYLHAAQCAQQVLLMLVVCIVAACCVYCCKPRHAPAGTFKHMYFAINITSQGIQSTAAAKIITTYGEQCCMQPHGHEHGTMGRIGHPVILKIVLTDCWSHTDASCCHPLALYMLQEYA